MKQSKVRRVWYFFLANWDLIIFSISSLSLGVAASLGRIPDPTTISSLILIAISLLMFSMLQTRVKFDKTVDKITHTDVYDSQEEMYSKIEQYIEDHDVKEAIFIQYSGETVKPILTKLVSRGTHITLYVQARSTARKFSRHQVDRIQRFPESIITQFPELFGEEETGRISIVEYEYAPPASLRAIRLDDKILAIGWYIYTYIDKENPMEKEKYKKYPQDEIKLLGHNQPGKLLYAGSREYAVMNKLFTHIVENFNKHIRLPGAKPFFTFSDTSHE